MLSPVFPTPKYPAVTPHVAASDFAALVKGGVLNAGDVITLAHNSVPAHSDQSRVSTIDFAGKAVHSGADLKLETEAVYFIQDQTTGKTFRFLTDPKGNIVPGSIQQGAVFAFDSKNVPAKPNSIVSIQPKGKALPVSRQLAGQPVFETPGVYTVTYVDATTGLKTTRDVTVNDEFTVTWAQPQGAPLAARFNNPNPGNGDIQVQLADGNWVSASGQSFPTGAKVNMRVVGFLPSDDPNAIDTLASFTYTWGSNLAQTFNVPAADSDYLPQGAHTVAITGGSNVNVALA